MRIVVNKETIFQMHNCFNNDERLGINFIPVQIYFVKKKKIIKRCDTNLIKIVNIYENIIKNNNVSMTRKGKKEGTGHGKDVAQIRGGTNYF